MSEEGIIFVTPGEFAGQHKKLSVGFVMGFVVFISLKLYMLALMGRPSLHSCDACMVYWVQGCIPEKLQAKTW